MKQGWEIKRLDDLCQIKTGKKDVNQGNLNGKYPFFTCAREHTFSDSFSFDTEALLIAGNGDVGNVSYYNGKFEAYQRTYVLFDFVNILPRFLFLILDGTLKKSMANKKLGNTMPYIKLGMLKEFEIPLPSSLLEQQRIVVVLDEAFAAIAKAKVNAEQNLKNAKELFESYLQGVFENKLHGSKFETLDSLCELIVDCEHKTAPTQETGYPSIRTPNIGKGVLILEGVNRVSEKVYNEWTRRAIPQADDLILAREAPAGNIAVIPENVKVCLGQRTVLIRPKKNKIVPKFLALLILSKDVQKQLLSHSTGATVEHINMKDIRAFKIYNLSPLTEQQSIVQKLDALSAETKKLEAIYQQKINDLEELKKSVLQKAFSGELKTDKLCV
jgi:type I restriction enzyme S subunit